MPMTKCTTCGRVCWTCGKCRNRTYCEFCNSCNLHGQDEPAPEMIRPPREARGRIFLVQVAFLTKRGWSETFEVRVPRRDSPARSGTASDRRDART